MEPETSALCPAVSETAPNPPNQDPRGSTLAIAGEDGMMVVTASQRGTDRALEIAAWGAYFCLATLGAGYGVAAIVRACREA